MAIIPWSKFEDIDEFFTGSFPAMDVYETDSAIVAEIQASGIKPEDIDISISSGFLKVKGEREEKEEKKKKGYWKKEIHRGSFERIVKLPVDVDDGKAEAVSEDGVIRITIPKAKGVKKEERKIKIKEASKKQKTSVKKSKK
ncbi:MAG: Hsp20/alpha crystallin family protein [Candidatus Colwellbacteria bacterium]|jgi:HSP20 family protein|nr:Hsp20/alpha crystallin family protein [Candidatus Colwellbacteria bacterium]MCK9497405.1 Hsp20/alpha crystallin family protein [Candidatus Colwellbacteria bacterium]MDD3752570.1 Hsp20/alpha crystallin family protein [Candidatus Colwellbacteria bacterium]MDD4818630.1 Hsp20/alpha crystallin family protein [Candidatus Colwellbacteria bacterium]